MFKHWATAHKDSKSPPKFQFRVMSCHKEPLGRMIDEAVKIKRLATMNSKSEFRSFKLDRIVVDKTSWEARKEEEEIERIEQAAEAEMSELRSKIAGFNVIKLEESF